MKLDLFKDKQLFLGHEPDVLNVGAARHRDIGDARNAVRQRAVVLRVLEYRVLEQRNLEETVHYRPQQGSSENVEDQRGQVGPVRRV